jgi:hypothetical protein
MTKKKSEADKKPAGRPAAVPYSDDLADQIFDLMADGHDVVDTCNILGIPRRTFYDWQENRPTFRALCGRAREALADFDARRIREEIETTTDANANAKRVKISGLQWFAERRNPRLYGHRTSTEVTGKDGGAIKTEATQRVDVSALDAEQRAQLRVLLTAVKPSGKP